MWDKLTIGDDTGEEGEMAAVMKLRPPGVALADKTQQILVGRPAPPLPAAHHLARICIHHHDFPQTHQIPWQRNDSTTNIKEEEDDGIT